MMLRMATSLLERVHVHGEESYPEEGAGLLLGRQQGDLRLVEQVLPLQNTFEHTQRARRYLIDPQAMIEAEEEAEAQGRSLLGVFHSHPNHPARPSEFDRKLALPWFIYVITSVQDGRAERSRAWLLREDRSGFEEIILEIDTSEEEAA